MSVFDSIIKDLVSQKRGGKNPHFPPRPCRPDVPGDPPKVRVPEPFCKTGPDIKRAIEVLRKKTV